MSIPGAVYFVTITKALLSPVHTHMHQDTHTHMHTQRATCTLTFLLSLPQGHFLTWEWLCLIVTNLLIWRDFPPSISLLSCFLPGLLHVGYLASWQLAVCTPKAGTFGWGVDFHQHNLVHNPSCWLLFLFPCPGPGTWQEAPCAAVLSPREGPPGMTSTAWSNDCSPAPGVPHCPSSLCRWWPVPCPGTR